jgi:nucleoside-diphosphate-sugar epimerase
VAEGAILAAESDRAVGDAYNCCHDGVLTQREYFDRVAAAIGASKVTQRVPYAVAYAAGFALEWVGHVRRSPKPPFITRYAIWLMGRRSFFECNKLKDHVGWKSNIGYEKGIPDAARDVLGTSR